MAEEKQEDSLNARVEAILGSLQEVPSAPGFIKALAGELSVHEKSLDRASRKQWNEIYKSGGNAVLEQTAGVVRENLRRYVVTNIQRARQFILKQLGEPVPLSATTAEVLEKSWVKLSDFVRWADHNNVNLPYAYGSFAAMSQGQNDWGLVKQGKTIFLDLQVFKKKLYDLHKKEGKIANTVPE